MSLNAVNIQGINVTNTPKKEILEMLEKFLLDGAWHTEKVSKKTKKVVSVVTPNPEQIVYAYKHPEFANVLNRADVALPDGVGLVWASRMLAKFPNSNFQSPIKETIPGIECMEELIALASNRHVPIALIGGRSGIAVKAIECLRQKHPDLMGVALDAPHFTIGPSGLSMSGPIDEYFKNLTAQLKRQRIGMVFVALGAPKQEYFMEQLALRVKGKGERVSTSYALHSTPLILMSVGGSLDELSGSLPRPPKWVSTIGLKWFWRLMLEPWRWKRQLSLIEFIIMVFKARATRMT